MNASKIREAKYPPLCPSPSSRPSSLSDLFKARVCMEDGPAKPNPFPVLRAAELMGVSPAQTALVSLLSVAIPKPTTL